MVGSVDVIDGRRRECRQAIERFNECCILGTKSVWRTICIVVVWMGMLLWASLFAGTVCFEFI